MVFNSIPFLLFFVVVFAVYWFPLKNSTRGQNIFLLLASYFFYGFANWRMLPLLIVATLIFFYLGKAIAQARSEKQSYWLTFLGVSSGVGALLYFKYFNFFIESFASLFAMCGLHANLYTFNIIMPLGISFYTFRILSYVIDIRRGKCEPTDDFVLFATYVAFFPCILSGPIDRPAFINQLKAPRAFDYHTAVDGSRQILWGLFKKVVVADNCAVFVDAIWNNIPSQRGSTLALSAVLYSFQMYADFSGYSDMAIGVGKLVGFRIAKNFNYPFFALNMADYWRRWHMSLTSWLTDYVFTPLNIRFRDWGKLGLILAIIINMVLVGLWHGANWTFAVFGLYHGLLFIPLILSGAFMKKAKLKTNKVGLPVPLDFGRMLLTFVLVTIGLIVFRAESIGQAWTYLCGMCNNSIFSVPWLDKKIYYIPQFVFISVMMIAEWVQRKKEFALDLEAIDNKWLRYGIYAILLVMMIWVGGEAETYIYFQF